MKPSSKDSADYDLPDGTEFSIWAVSDTDDNPWAIFWIEFLRPEPLKTWYRVYPTNKAPGEWQPMKTSDEVLEQTGFADDPEVLSDDDDGGPQLGAAEKLPKGRYVFQVKVVASKKEIEFPGVTFRVK